MSTVTIIVVTLGYLLVLFAVASFCDRQSIAGRSVVGNPYVYSLSLAVYATSWTFFGSVGRAAQTSVGFLPIYIGPTLAAALWWVVLRKMIRISKANRLTSIADFIDSRYGKSGSLAALVTVVAVIGLTPYIALQLKAVSNSFNVLHRYPHLIVGSTQEAAPLLSDTAFYAAIVLAAFSILFGTRRMDVSERHEGMVGAIAFESIVKLAAFLCVGIFVTYVMFDGLGDLFQQASVIPSLATLFTMSNGGYEGWGWLTLLSMLAFMCLPRQFHVAVVENVDERHVLKAVWLLPLYMFAINIFVLPIAVGGLIRLAGTPVDPDTFVLFLPMLMHQEMLALLVFIGGLAAATGMAIVETVALSTMICNDLVMPVLLRWKWLDLDGKSDLSGLLRIVRRCGIVFLLALGYAYYRATAQSQALVSIGLASFAAVAQFAPSMLGGMYWKGGTRTGALAGLILGFSIWVYTVLLPSFAESGWLARSFIQNGPFNILLLKPLALFAFASAEPLTQSVFWSLAANIGAYVGVSLFTRQDAHERAQAVLFVDSFRLAEGSVQLPRGPTTVEELQSLARRFLGHQRADDAFREFAARRSLEDVSRLQPDADLIHFVETLLGGSIGAASARLMLATLVREQPLRIDEVLKMLDEASQVIAYSRQLEAQSRALELVTADLRTANDQLKELDRLKDDFVSTVTHELRTPLASIRALSEIVHANPELEVARRSEFLGIVIKETERLTRLINQVLDLSKIEMGNVAWDNTSVNISELVEEAAASLNHLLHSNEIALTLNVPSGIAPIYADSDRLLQVLLNLLSNAAKFRDPNDGRITVTVQQREQHVQVDVTDNGPGIAAGDRERIFEKFGRTVRAAPGTQKGSGLGLAISRRIVEHHGGHLWVTGEYGKGATFSFTVPLGSVKAQKSAMAESDGPAD